MSDTSTSLGAQIPPELFERIVLSAVQRASHNGLYRMEITEESTEMLHTLCVFSRVCLPWAKLCRATMFATTLFRKKGHAQALDSLLDLPCAPRLTPLSTLFSWFAVEDNIISSWTHELPFLFRKRRTQLSHVRIMRFTLSSYPLPVSSNSNSKAHPIRSIFHYLPRTVPGIAYRLTTVKLIGVRFTFAADFFALVQELVDLRVIVANDLDWDPSSPLSPPFRVPRFLKRCYFEDSKRSRLGGRGMFPWVVSCLAYDALTIPPKIRSRRLRQASVIEPEQAVPSVDDLSRCHPSEIRPLIDLLWSFRMNRLAIPSDPSCDKDDPRMHWEFNIRLSNFDAYTKRHNTFLFPRKCTDHSSSALHADDQRMFL